MDSTFWGFYHPNAETYPIIKSQVQIQYLEPFKYSTPDAGRGLPKTIMVFIAPPSRRALSRSFLMLRDLEINPPTLDQCELGTGDDRRHQCTDDI
ncbi:hypothetical protein EVAR_95896_1 [Eumeta japonica]|uniref:Uncharacterized protein n=1 Tax=Eumeta variegata TaxID=151549 RepID=A0A4C1XG77_EUMVA|nr:hypothetical protein EVAR_95896_1 [Eumeta japonica]